MIKAESVIRYVPLVYLASPSTGRRIGVAIHKGLIAADAKDLATRTQQDPFGDTPMDILHELRLVKLIDFADDWRFMTAEEIDHYLSETPPFYENYFEIGAQNNEN